MRVYIGPYTKWVGPYQIADMIPFISEDTKHMIGTYLSKTWLNNFCNWIDERKNRKIKVYIDDYDTWNADQTMALIILPLLKKLKEHKQGSPHVDNDDVPSQLRYNDPEPGWKEDGNWQDGGGNWVHYKWEWVLNEIIWTFEQINSDWEDQYIIDQGEIDWDSSKLQWTKPHIVDNNGMKEHQERINNGLRLFGKYYQTLWS